MPVQTVCSPKACPAGFEQAFGDSSSWASSWYLKLGYYCDPCRLNYVKEHPGYHPCRPCPSYFLSNKLHTKCIDPFYWYLIDTSGHVGRASFIGSIIVAFLTLAFIIVFAINYSTPLVKLSDRTFTFIHLLIIFVLNALLPVLYFGESTETLCILRPFSVAVLYNGSVSVILVKSNKLVQAFKAKIKINGSEVLRTKLTQCLVVACNVAVGFMIVIVLLQSDPVRVISTQDFQTMLRIDFCSNEGHLNVVNSFTILIQCACFVQAFRCRNLPHFLNEASTILYLSFSTTVSSLTMYPIYFFQKNKLHAAMVHLLTFQFNNAIILLLFYGRRFYLLLFRPRSNTPRYFRQQQMMAIQMKVQSRNLPG